MMTPINRFSVKNEPKMMKMTKYRYMSILSSRLGWESSCEARTNGREEDSRLRRGKSNLGLGRKEREERNGISSLIHGIFCRYMVLVTTLLNLVLVTTMLNFEKACLLVCIFPSVLDQSPFIHKFIQIHANIRLYQRKRKK